MLFIRKNGKEIFNTIDKLSYDGATDKKGKVYDIRFWIIEDGKRLHKQLSGFATKKLAREGFAEFVNENCTLVKGSPLRKVNAKKDELVFKDLYDQYTKAMSNQLKDARVIGR